MARWSDLVMRVAGKRKRCSRRWINALQAKKPKRVAAVALANKLAGFCWAIMTTGEGFRVIHTSRPEAQPTVSSSIKNRSSSVQVWQALRT